MFNLLMLGNDEDWRVAPGTVHEATFPLARYLEYTNEAVEQRLKPITQEARTFLAGLTTVFMSELSGRPNEREFLTIRFGSVWDIRVEGKDLVYKFSISRDFGEFDVIDRKAFEAQLDFGKWELTRSHWAIKLSDPTVSFQQAELSGVIVASGGRGPQFSLHPQNALPYLQLPAEEAAPPVIDSLVDFMNHVLNLSVGTDDEIFYRGHSDRRYRLIPTLFRKNDAGDWRYLRKEETIVRELLTAQAPAFGSDEYMLDKLVRMQHYGLPTRLLDVTSNPLVSLYFCCAEEKFDENGDEIDGEVIILKTKIADVRFFDSDTVSCIANICLLTDDEKEQMDSAANLIEFNETMECKKLLHFIRREKPYFESRIVPSDLEKITFVRGRNTNERITSQSGAFLLFGKDSVLPETGYSSLDVQRVRIRNKRGILQQLAKLNIKSSTIYPGIEKTTAEIARKHEVAAR